MNEIKQNSPYAWFLAARPKTLTGLVRRAMGHNSVVTTQRYDLRDEDEVRTLTDRLAL